MEEKRKAKKKLSLIFSLFFSLSQPRPPPTTKKIRPLRSPRRDPAPALPGPPRPPSGHPQRGPHRDRREGLRRKAAGAAVPAREGEVRETKKKIENRRREREEKTHWKKKTRPKNNRYVRATQAVEVASQGRFLVDQFLNQLVDK